MAKATKQSVEASTNIKQIASCLAMTKKLKRFTS